MESGVAGRFAPNDGVITPNCHPEQAQSAVAEGSPIIECGIRNAECGIADAEGGSNVSEANYHSSVSELSFDRRASFLIRN